MIIENINHNDLIVVGYVCSKSLAPVCLECTDIQSIDKEQSTKVMKTKTYGRLCSLCKRKLLEYQY